MSCLLVVSGCGPSKLHVDHVDSQYSQELLMNPLNSILLRGHFSRSKSVSVPWEPFLFWNLGSILFSLAARSEAIVILLTHLPLIDARHVGISVFSRCMELWVYQTDTISCATLADYAHGHPHTTATVTYLGDDCQFGGCAHHTFIGDFG